MNDGSSLSDLNRAEGDYRSGSVKASVVYAVIAFVLGTPWAGGACATDSVMVAVRVTVVPVCRFLTPASPASSVDTGSARSVPAAGSATLTYACSNGTAPAFTFAVPADTNLACGSCPGIPLATGHIVTTSQGAGQGLGSGRDRTLTVRAPPAQAAYEIEAPDAYASTIIVTVSP